MNARDPSVLPKRPRQVLKGSLSPMSRNAISEAVSGEPKDDKKSCLQNSSAAPALLGHAPAVFLVQEKHSAQCIGSSVWFSAIPVPVNLVSQLVSDYSRGNRGKQRQLNEALKRARNFPIEEFQLKVLDEDVYERFHTHT